MAKISREALVLLEELTLIPQVVGYDHRIAELDTAKPRLIVWVPGKGYLASHAGLAALGYKVEA